MKLFSIFSLICFFQTLVSVTGLPQAIPVENSEFDIDNYVNEILGDAFSQDELLAIEELGGELKKRDLESSIESVLNLVNRTGIIWDALDYVIDNPDSVGNVLNLTRGLLGGGDDDEESSSSNSTFLLNFVFGIVQEVNLTSLANSVIDSGLLQSLLDGLLLEDKYRERILDIIYQIVESNMEAITDVAHDLLAPANHEKRDDGSLVEFAGNVVGGFLGSSLFYDGLDDVMSALNDSGIVVYIAQRFISTPKYVNYTGGLIQNALENSDFNILALLGSIDIEQLLSRALSDTSAITSTVGSILEGAGASTEQARGVISRYVPAVRSIIEDLEDKGLFTDLNENIFPSNSVERKESEPTLMSSSSSASDSASESSVSDSGSNLVSNNLFMNGLIWLPTMIIGAVFFA